LSNHKKPVATGFLMSKSLILIIMSEANNFKVLPKAGSY